MNETDTARLRPIRRGGATALPRTAPSPSVGVRQVQSIGRDRARHYCDECGQKLNRCSCDGGDE